MENLSDVEFGSDKGGEEAPILVAQRYLNIFRQIHIFKKEKRDQFDDELLALSPSVTDFFKRMPGGRLLVEHIEDVKTERGISFVKAKREDFTNGDDLTPAEHPSDFKGHISGGNVVMDSSFAETFSKSLAEAFKQVPAMPAGGGEVSFSSDLGKSFELIAEEIHSSRASLLDVLRETRNITDTVISSQVAISKMLENLLESNKYTDSSSTDLNNRILASQAAITKLLENLCSNYSQNSSHDLSSNQLEERLSQFRQQLHLELAQSLANINSSASIEAVHSSTAINPKQEENSAVSDFPSEANDISSFSAEENNLKSNTSVDYQSYEESNMIDKKKKKKKKKKSHENLSSIDGTSLVVHENQNTFSTEPVTSIQSIDGIIKNDSYKFDDDFNNIDLRNPPLETTDDVLSKNIYTNSESGSQYGGSESVDGSSSFDESDDDLDFSLPQQIAVLGGDDDQKNTADDAISFNTDVDGDDLDFSLPPQNSALNGDDDQKNTADDIVSFNTDVTGDDLDFSLPPQNSALNGNDEQKNTSDDIVSFNTNVDGDDLDFSLPQQIAVLGDNDEEKSKADDVISFNTDDTGDDLDFSLQEKPVQQSSNTLSDIDIVNSLSDSGVSLTETVSPSSDENLSLQANALSPSDSLDDLDDFLNENSDSSESTDAVDLSNLDKTLNKDTELSGDAALSSQAVGVEPLDNDTDELHGRYSAELDKIRQALTSDSIDLSSLDTPISLDDYAGDNENISKENNIYNTPSNSNYDKNAANNNSKQNQAENLSDNSSANTQDDDWDWEYVDENGNIVSSQDDDQDWEWEYVEDDGSDTTKKEDENKK